MKTKGTVFVNTYLFFLVQSVKYVVTFLSLSVQQVEMSPYCQYISKFISTQWECPYFSGAAVVELVYNTYGFLYKALDLNPF